MVKFQFSKQIKLVIFEVKFYLSFQTKYFYLKTNFWMSNITKIGAVSPPRLLTHLQTVSTIFKEHQKNRNDRNGTGGRPLGCTPYCREFPETTNNTSKNVSHWITLFINFHFFIHHKQRSKISLSKTNSFLTFFWKSKKQFLKKKF